MEGNTDVVEICALLQCLGYSVKSMDTSDTNLSQDGGVRSVVINCQSSGLHVVLESSSTSCSCPATDKQNSGFWQVSGVAGGKPQDKESGSTLLGSMSKNYREHLTKELAELVKGIRIHNDDQARPKEVNRSTSMLEIKTPEKLHMKLKIDTPTRYRSLDTLTAKDESVQPLPAPRKLARVDSDTSTEAPDPKKIMCRRQSTYTLASSPSSFRRRNKTSSPIQPHPNTLIDELVAAEKIAESLRNQLSSVIKDILDDGKNDSSISSLALDVSKISVLKEPNKNQFASSPNLSGLGTREEITNSRLKRTDSASTSTLLDRATPKDMKSKLRRLSPSFFKGRKDSPSVADKPKTDSKSKLNSLFRPKIVTPVRIPKLNPESSPNLSASRKKYSHIKSTIPRAMSTKRE